MRADDVRALLAALDEYEHKVIGPNPPEGQWGHSNPERDLSIRSIRPLAEAWLDQQAKIARVEELHSERTGSPANWCAGCGMWWPCATRRALLGETE